MRKESGTIQSPPCNLQAEIFYIKKLDSTSPARILGGQNTEEKSPFLFKKESAPHSSRTLLRGGNPNPAEFQKSLVSVLRTLPPAKLFRKTESIFT